MARSIVFAFKGPSIHMKMQGFTGPSCDAALQETLKDSKFRPEPGSVTATSDYHQAAPIEETQVNQQYLEN